MAPLTLQQLEARSLSIGGSDAAAACGVSPYKTPLDLYFEKTGLNKPDDISSNQAVYWGSTLENVIAEEYARREDVELIDDQDTLYHPENSFMSAHLDRRIKGQNKILECKTANAFLEREWGEIGTDEVPLHYIVQVQHYLAVTGVQEADLAVLIGGQDFRIYNMQRDNDLIHDLIKAEQVFWARIDNLNPPPPSNLDDLNLLFSTDDGEAIEASAAIVDTIRSLKSCKQALKDQEAIKDELEFGLKKFMASNTTVLMTGTKKPMATWKSQSNNRFQTTEFKKDHPGLYNDYVQDNPTRVLRLKK